MHLAPAVAVPEFSKLVARGAGLESRLLSRKRVNGAMQRCTQTFNSFITHFPCERVLEVPRHAAFEAFVSYVMMDERNRSWHKDHWSTSLDLPTYLNKRSKYLCSVSQTIRYSSHKHFKGSVTVAPRLRDRGRGMMSWL